MNDEREPQSYLSSMMGLEVLAVLLCLAVIGFLAQTARARMLEVELAKAERSLDAAGIKRSRATGSQKRVDQPPIVTLSESDGYYFVSGSSELSDGFRGRLTTVASKIAEITALYEVDVVEIVGHTDEMPLGRGYSNLDGGLLAYLDGGSGGTLTAGDNVGLGMSRAAAVVRELRRFQQLRSLTVIPLSAGHVVRADGKVSHGDKRDDELRRRIEIRLRRSTVR